MVTVCDRVERPAPGEDAGRCRRRGHSPKPTHPIGSTSLWVSPSASSVRGGSDEQVDAVQAFGLASAAIPIDVAGRHDPRRLEFHRLWPAMSTRTVNALDLSRLSGVSLTVSLQVGSANVQLGRQRQTARTPRHRVQAVVSCRSATLDVLGTQPRADGGGPPVADLTRTLHGSGVVTRGRRPSARRRGGSR
jgi:hypothetical protein